MKIVFIHRNIFQNRPPVISVISHLTKLEKQPILITAGINEEYRNLLISKGVKVIVIPFQLKGNVVRNYIDSKKWGWTVEKCIRELSKNEKLLLWIEGNYTFASLSAKIINKYPHILQIQELIDDYGFKGWIKESIYKRKIGKIAQPAIGCIVNEYNRAHLIRAFFKLNKLPYILPNKPAFILSEDELKKLDDIYKEYNNVFEKKVIIYQGLLTTGRSNFVPYLEAVKRLNEQSNEYRVVFVGKDFGMVNQYKKLGYDFVHIPFVPAPNYLYFTSKAYIGIVTYIPDILNNVYCAPNKIFEYAAYGIPILGNDIPGLRFTIDANHCGKVSDDTPESVYEQLLYIINHYEEMSIAAKQFFDATDNYATVGRIISDIESTIGHIE